jgi:hypothetical protein
VSRPDSGPLFIGADDEVPAWLEFLENGNPMIQPDKYGAMQLLAAASGSDPDDNARAMERILRERPALPLLSGLVFFGLAFGLAMYGERRTEIFAQLSLEYGVDEGMPQ